MTQSDRGKTTRTGMKAERLDRREWRKNDRIPRSEELVVLRGMVYQVLQDAESGRCRGGCAGSAP